MPKQYTLKDQPMGYGYITKPQHGGIITDDMVKRQMKKKEEDEPDAWEAKKRKELIKAFEEIKGIWADDKDFDRRLKEREKIEIAAAKKMRKAW